jgi:hypothetical protein
MDPQEIYYIYHGSIICVLHTLKKFIKVRFAFHKMGFRHTLNRWESK